MEMPNEQLNAEITEHKNAKAQLVESETRFREMFHCVSSGVVVYEAVDNGRDFIFKDFNHAAERFEKVKREDIIGRKVTEIFPGIEEFGLLDVFCRVWDTGNSEFFPVSLYKDGRISGWRDNYVYKLPSGEIFAVYEDVTERKQAEEAILAKSEELLASNQQLLSSEQQLKASNQQLRANEEERASLVKMLEYKNKELQDIVYTTSHDLKSPLVNIEGFSGVLNSDCERLIKMLADQNDGEDKRENIEDLLKEGIPQSLGFIAGSAKKMSNLLDGLLQISRVGTVEIKSESIDVNKMISEVLAATQHQIKKCNISVEVETFADCIGDSNMVNQVFSNLIGNAIKYRDPAKESEIEISGRVEGGMGIYCVADNGIGIDPGHQNKVFEIFHRLNPMEDIEGDGLGLTIVTRIMDRLGGKVWLESEEGKGSKFFIALPTV